MSAHVIKTSVKAYNSAAMVVCVYQAYYESKKIVKAVKVLAEIAFEIMI